MDEEMEFAADQSNPAFKAPMQLLKPSPDHNSLVVVPETIEALASVKDPVSVVTGVGSQRLGKSTLLNLFHSRVTAGFGLGHTLDAQTTGLWIWLRRHPKQQETVICLMDTEGLDSPHISNSYNWMLSSLALLISNTFLYQTKNSIDSSATERLSTILAVAEQLRGSNTAFFSDQCTHPAFVWILRDMQLKMRSDPKSEMVSKLEDSHLRKMKKFFRGYDCVPLPRPVDSEEQLQKVDEMEFSELKGAFLEDYYMLERQIFNLASETSMIGAEKINGSMLADIVDKYVRSIASRSGLLMSIQSIPTCAQIIGQMAGERAIKAATHMYETAISDLLASLPLACDDVCNRHDVILEQSKKRLEVSDVAKWLYSYKSTCDERGVWMQICRVQDPCKVQTDFKAILFQDMALGVEEGDLIELVKGLEKKACEYEVVLKKGVGDCNDYCSARMLKGGTLHTVLERNREANKQKCARSWDESFATVTYSVGSNEIKNVVEYDRAISNIQLSVLDVATRENRRNFMIEHLDDYDTRQQIERLRSQIQLLSMKYDLMSDFQENLSNIKSDLSSKIEKIDITTSMQLESLANQLKETQVENAKNIHFLDVAVKNIQNSVIPLLENNLNSTRSYLELQMQTQTHNFRAVADQLSRDQKQAVDRIEILQEKFDRDIASARNQMKEKLHEAVCSLDKRIEITNKVLQSSIESEQSSTTKLKAELSSIQADLSNQLKDLSTQAMKCIAELRDESNDSKSESQSLNSKIIAINENVIANHEAQQEHLNSIRTQALNDVQQLGILIESVRTASFQDSKSLEERLNCIYADSTNKIGQEIVDTRNQLELQLDERRAEMDVMKEDFMQRQQDIKEILEIMQKEHVKQLETHKNEVLRSHTTFEQETTLKINSACNSMEGRLNDVENIKALCFFELEKLKGEISLFQTSLSLKTSELFSKVTAKQDQCVGEMQEQINNKLSEIDLKLEVQQSAHERGANANQILINELREQLFKVEEVFRKEASEIDIKFSASLASALRMIDDQIAAARGEVDGVVQSQQCFAQSIRTEMLSGQQDAKDSTNHLRTNLESQLSILECEISAVNVRSEQSMGTTLEIVRRKLEEDLNATRDQIESYAAEQRRLLQSTRSEIDVQVKGSISAFQEQSLQLQEQITSSLRHIFEHREELGVIQMALNQCKEVIDKMETSYKSVTDASKDAITRIEILELGGGSCREQLDQIQGSCTKISMLCDRLETCEATNNHRFTDLLEQFVRLSCRCDLVETENKNEICALREDTKIANSAGEEKIVKFYNEVNALAQLCHTEKAEKTQLLEVQTKLEEVVNSSARSMQTLVSEIREQLFQCVKDMLEDGQKIGQIQLTLQQNQDLAAEVQGSCQMNAKSIETLTILLEKSQDIIEQTTRNLKLMQEQQILASQANETKICSFTQRLEEVGNCGAVMRTINLPELETKISQMLDENLSMINLEKKLSIMQSEMNVLHATSEREIEQIRMDFIKIQQDAASLLSTELSNFGKTLQILQEQHTTCLTEILRDRQEIGEIQLNVEQVKEELKSKEDECVSNTEKLCSLIDRFDRFQLVADGSRERIEQVNLSYLDLKQQQETFAAFQQMFELQCGNIAARTKCTTVSDHSATKHACPTTIITSNPSSSDKIVSTTDLMIDERMHLEAENTSFLLQKDELLFRPVYQDKVILKIRQDVLAKIENPLREFETRICELYEKVASITAHGKTIQSENAGKLIALRHEIDGAHAASSMHLDHRIDSIERKLVSHIESHRELFGAEKKQSVQQSSVGNDEGKHHKTDIIKIGYPDIDELKSELKQDIYWFRRDTDSGLEDLSARIQCLETNLRKFLHDNPCSPYVKVANDLLHCKRSEDSAGSGKKCGQYHNCEELGISSSAYSKLFPAPTTLRGQEECRCIPAMVRAMETETITLADPKWVASENSFEPQRFSFEPSPVRSHQTVAWQINDEKGILTHQLLRQGRNIEALFQAVSHIQETLQVLADRAQANSAR